MERQIGEIFEYNGEWYQCVKCAIYCPNCTFFRKKCNSQVLGECGAIKRSDKENVIFKKLEKIGEPFSCNYYGDSRLVMMQEYQLFDLNVIYCYQTPPMYITDYKHKRIAIEIKQTKEDMEEKKVKLDKLVTDYTSNKITYNEFEKAVKELYSDKEESKSTLKEFDLESAKSGKPVCTRDGRKARIICFDRKGKQPIIALVIQDNGEEFIENYHLNGRFNVDDTFENDKDLMMLPEKKDGWVNVYSNCLGGPYESKEYALKQKMKDCIDTVKISWEE